MTNINENDTALRAFIAFVLALGVYAACAVSGLYLVLMLPFYTLLTAVPLLYVYMRTNRIAAVSGFLAAAAALIYVIGYLSSAVYLAYALPVVIAGGFILKSHKQYQLNIALMSLAVLAGLVLVCVLLKVYFGDPVMRISEYVVSDVSSYDAESAEAAREAFANALSFIQPDGRWTAASLAEVSSLTAGIGIIISTVLPMVLISFSFITGMLVYAISMWWLGRAKQGRIFSKPELGYLPPFYMWALPKGAGIGCVITMLLMAVLPALGVKGLTEIRLALVAFFLIAFYVQGLAFVAAMFQITRLPRWAKNLGVILTGIIFAYIMVFAGMFEQMFKLRRVLAPREGVRTFFQRPYYPEDDAGSSGEPVNRDTLHLDAKNEDSANVPNDADDDNREDEIHDDEDDSEK